MCERTAHAASRTADNRNVSPKFFHPLCILLNDRPSRISIVEQVRQAVLTLPTVQWMRTLSFPGEWIEAGTWYAPKNPCVKSPLDQRWYTCRCARKIKIV
jgi:hypothetical protein